MKKSYALVLSALLFLGACGSSVEDRQEEIADLMEEAAGVLADVKEPSDVEAAKPRLEKIANKIQELGEEIDKTPAEELQKTTQKQAENLANALQKLEEQWERLATQPAIMEKLADVFGRIKQ